ncbi:Peptidase M16 inactive domain protein [Pirellula sp. SH-Sr6A]|nr:Peptidase M16 inactive domain protein [Pirellula sp. SH-Sr6A]
MVVLKRKDVLILMKSAFTTESIDHLQSDWPSRALRSCLAMFLVLGTYLSDRPHLQAENMPTKVASVEGINEYRLDNGLKVLLFVDNSQPKVTVNCTVFVGSRHEGYGEAGMAHLLEHMVFKGTDLNPEIPKALKDRGATFNGTTWVDRTNYYETLPASNENLEFAIRLEADRLVNSKILGEDLASEFSVVRSEFERGENNPIGVLRQRMLSAAFQWHNYGKSTIGNRTDIERVPVDNLRAFYRKYYRPDNAMVIVAGKFEEAKALEYVQKYFGVLARPKQPLPATYTVEPPQDGERITMVRRVADIQAVGAVYHVPAGGDPEYPAIDLLAEVLTDEPSGRLYKSMIETKLATGVFGGAEGLHDPGTILFLAQVPLEKSLEKAESAMLETLENLVNAPVTEEEVSRAKQKILNQRERAAARSDSLAISLSDWAAQGDWKLYFLYRDGIEKTTAAQVQVAAQKYLVRNNRTVGRFMPADRSDRIQIPERPDVNELVKDYKGREAISEGEQFDPSPANIESRLVRGKLASGLPYAFLAKKTRGATVNLTLNLRFGDEKSLFGKSAACDLFGEMLMRGTKNLPLQQFNDKLASLKATVRASSRPQSLTIGLETRREHLAEVLEVIEEMLRNPAFEEKEFELIRDQVLTSLESQKSEPQALANLAVSRTLNPYKRGDIRYLPTIDEEIEDFQKLSIADIVDLHAKYLSGTEGEVAIVGDFDAEEIEPKLSKMLGNWKSKVPFQRAATSATTDVKLPLQSIETPDKANSVYFASQQYALRDDHPKYPALLIGNQVLGAGALSSRLGDRVRQKEGLSYGVNSNLASSSIDERTVFYITAIANPKNRDKLVATIDEEVRKLVKDGITSQELQDTVQGYLQNQQLIRSRDVGLAGLLANNIFTGRDMSYYEKLESAVSQLTVDAVNDAIAEYIDPDTLVVATAGDFQAPTPPPPSKP